MHAAERLNVMIALSMYAARNNDYAMSEKYGQQAKALEQTHYLPDDLVKMAEAAIARGDQETLRRVWARFLLQQRQIPTWLYQHVAQAYLELGDSYRKDADVGAEAARLATARLRAEALKQEAPK
jgi:predicted anti-sigma-YlaC factor YlaD